MVPTHGDGGRAGPGGLLGGEQGQEPARCRSDAVRVLMSVLAQGRSLADALPDNPSPLLSELVFGVTRWYWRLRAAADELLQKPLRRKDADIDLLILVGLYQLEELRIPHHAAINETVKAAEYLGKGWAKGLLNGVLRNYARRPGWPERVPSDVARYSHPQWLLEHTRASWPGQWRRILEANNERAPMVLRVNCRRMKRTEYLRELARSGLDGRIDELSSQGVVLEKPVSVDKLPGFPDGVVSVQDSAAQWAAPALPVESGHRILDACSAPGGKLTHILEMYPHAGSVLAIDNSNKRTEMIEDNLRRLGLFADVRVADAGDLDSWWDGRPFDCVLLDAPCTGSGVIRRHPDIKHLRRPEDLAKLSARQASLLNTLWCTLAPRGHLLYVTCSIFPQENEVQVERFVTCGEDVDVLPVSAPAGWRSQYGLQTLPGVHNVDGFYYSLMQKIHK